MADSRFPMHFSEVVCYRFEPEGLVPGDRKLSTETADATDAVEDFDPWVPIQPRA